MKKLILLFLVIPVLSFAGDHRRDTTRHDRVSYSVGSEAAATICNGLYPFDNLDLQQIYCQVVANGGNVYNPSSLCTPVFPFSNLDLWQIYCAIKADSGTGGGGGNIKGNLRPPSIPYTVAPDSLADGPLSVSGSNVIVPANLQNSSGSNLLTFNDGGFSKLTSSGVNFILAGALKGYLLHSTSTGSNGISQSALDGLRETDTNKITLQAPLDSIEFSSGTPATNYVWTCVDNKGHGQWSPAGSGGSAWNLTGNSGTVPGTNFLGTTDLQPLVIKTNSIENSRFTYDALSQVNSLQMYIPMNYAQIVLKAASGVGQLNFMDSINNHYISITPAYGQIASSTGELSVESSFVFGVAQNFCSTGTGFNLNGGALNTNQLFLSPDNYTVEIQNLAGNSSTPTAVAGTGAGTSPTITVAGTNCAGTITVSTGTAPSLSATVLTLTISNSLTFPNSAVVVLQPINSVTAILSGVTNVYVTNTTTGFVIHSGTTALVSATTYAWNYVIIGF